MIRASRRRRRQRKKSKLLQRLRTAFVLLCFVAFLGFIGLFASFGYTYRALGENMPELDDYASTELAQTSVVYDADGKVVDELYGVQNRFVVSFDVAERGGSNRGSPLLRA
jgi:penicillin-binding protein 1A